MTRKRDPATNAILAATVVGLLLRLGWWWYASPEPVSDFEQARQVAAGLLDHHQFGYPNLDAGRMPAYPLLLAALMLVSRSAAWLSFATVLLSTLIVPLVGALARRLGLSDRTAAAAAFICALNPTFVFFAPVLATEHLFGVCLIGAFVLLLGASQRADEGLTRRRCAFAGAMIGLGTLARMDALFYVPLFLIVAWMRSPRPRLAGPAVLLICMAIVLAPWFVRNRVVMGPGAGLSTAGGLTFYYAHNTVKYGWHPLRGTALEGLNQLEVQHRGYALGLDYLAHAGPRRLASDILTGTMRLYSPLSSPYALRWSTRLPGATVEEFSAKPLAGMRVFEGISGLYAVLLSGALLSLAFIRRFTTMAAVVLYGIVLMNWIGHGWIFVGDPRYRFAAEIAFCVLTAFAMDQMLHLRRAGQLSRTAER